MPPSFFGSSQTTLIHFDDQKYSYFHTQVQRFANHHITYSSTGRMLQPNSRKDHAITGHLLHAMRYYPDDTSIYISTIVTGKTANPS